MGNKVPAMEKTKRCVRMSNVKDCEDDILEDRDPCADKDLNNEDQQNFPEGDNLYLEMLQYMSENKRCGGNRPLQEDDKDIVSLFWREFPAQRDEIAKCISCIRELADHIDKTHKDCTIATITASSAGATSGILTIVGLALIPVTAGASLILTATGVGVGAAAATTGISASLSEHFINSKKNRRAQDLIEKCEKILNGCKERVIRMMSLSEVHFSSALPEDKKANMGNVQHFISKTSQIARLPSAVKEMLANVKAFKNLDTALKTLARGPTNAVRGTFQASAKAVDNVDDVFKGTALAASKGAQVMSGIFAAAVLLFNIYCIVKDAQHLVKGAKSTMAAEIREKASNLEDILQNLNNLYQEQEHAGSK